MDEKKTMHLKYGLNGILINSNFNISKVRTRFPMCQASNCTKVVWNGEMQSNC